MNESPRPKIILGTPAYIVKRNDILMLLDADAQHNPEKIPSLIRAISEGSDLVIASRRIGRNKIPRYRYGGQELL